MEDRFEDGFKASELTVFLDSIHHHSERSLEIIRVNTCKLFRALMKYAKLSFTFFTFSNISIFSSKRGSITSGTEHKSKRMNSV